MKGWQWWLASLPFFLGLLAMFILNGLEILSNPILYLRIDAGMFLFLLGCLLSALWLEGLYLWSQTESRLAAAQKESNQEHRRFLQRLDHELKNPLTAILAGLANIAYATDTLGRFRTPLATMIYFLSPFTTCSTTPSNSLSPMTPSNYAPQKPTKWSSSKSPAPEKASRQTNCPICGANSIAEKKHAASQAVA